MAKRKSRKGRAMGRILIRVRRKINWKVGEEKRENGLMMIEVELGKFRGGGNGDMGIKS